MRLGGWNACRPCLPSPNGTVIAGAQVQQGGHAERAIIPYKLKHFFQCLLAGIGAQMQLEADIALLGINFSQVRQAGIQQLAVYNFSQGV